MSVYPFRLTAEDLAELDTKTRNGLQPLLDALNETLGQLVNVTNSARTSVFNSGTFETDSAGSAYVYITRPATKPTVVLDAFLGLVDGGDVSSVYGFSWQLIGNNVRALYVNLTPETKYSFTVEMK